MKLKPEGVSAKPQSANPKEGTQAAGSGELHRQRKLVAGCCELAKCRGHRPELVRDWPFPNTWDELGRVTASRDRLPFGWDERL
jgi:hypothetical protein